MKGRLIKLQQLKHERKITTTKTHEREITTTKTQVTQVKDTTSRYLTTSYTISVTDTTASL